MTKILLIAGHGAGDPGAVGNGLQEATETRDVVNRVAPLLQAKGFEVTVLNQAINAYAELQNGRVPFGSGYDYVLEVHFNSAAATSANGTEIYVTTSETATTVEQKIMANLSKFFSNRGVKQTNFSVIYQAKRMGMSSALLEVCFISSPADIQKYQANKQAIAQSIADGVAEGFGKNGSVNVTAPSTGGNVTAGDSSKIQVTELLKSTVETWVPQWQKKYAPLLLATRVRGEGKSKIILEGIPVRFVDKVYNILRTGQYKIPSQQLDSDKNNGKIVISELAQSTQVKWVPLIQKDTAGYMLADDLHGNASGINICNIPNASAAATIRQSIHTDFKVPTHQIK